MTGVDGELWASYGGTALLVNGKLPFQGMERRNALPND